MKCIFHVSIAMQIQLARIVCPMRVTEPHCMKGKEFLYMSAIDLSVIFVTENTSGLLNINGQATSYHQRIEVSYFHTLCGFKIFARFNI